MQAQLKHDPMCELKIRRVGIIHGTGGSERKHWQTWLAAQCRDQGLEVHYPKLPRANHPQLSAWLEALKRALPVIDRETALVCHSLGCVTSLQLLKDEGIKELGMLVLVAPPALSKVLASEYNFQAHFFDGLDDALIKAAIKARRVVLFESVNDHRWGDKKELGYWKEALDPKVHIVRNGGHINLASGHHTLQPALDLLSD